ncbi:hypothetical protein RUND412_008201 [Rhizina undulata]
MAAYTVSAQEARAVQSYLASRTATLTSSPKTAFTTLPIIDLAPSYSPSLASRLSVASQIRAACTTSGFFYITSHTIPQSTIDSVFHHSKRFFHEYPQAKKKVLHIKHSSIFRGWEPGGYTTLDPGDQEEGKEESKEAFNWGYESELDPNGDPEYKQEAGVFGLGRNVWPEEEDLPGFKKAVAEYYGKVLELARHLFRLFALSLELPEDHFDKLMTHPGGIARILYYPPQDLDLDDRTIGLGAHTDYECFTILAQDAPPSPDAAGLQVLNPEGTWIDAKPIPGALVVNVADFMMRWSNDVYKSTVHRVINKSEAPRYSLPFFFSINYDALVETLPSCITPENPSKYPPIVAGEYILGRLQMTREIAENEK